jgi:hypothetical protein
MCKAKDIREGGGGVERNYAQKKGGGWRPEFVLTPNFLRKLWKDGRGVMGSDTIPKVGVFHENSFCVRVTQTVIPDWVDWKGGEGVDQNP